MKRERKRGEACRNAILRTAQHSNRVGGINRGPERSPDAGFLGREVLLDELRTGCK